MIRLYILTATRPDLLNEMMSALFELMPFEGELRIVNVARRELPNGPEWDCYVELRYPALDSQGEPYEPPGQTVQTIITEQQGDRMMQSIWPKQIGGDTVELPPPPAWGDVGEPPNHRAGLAAIFGGEPDDYLRGMEL